MATAVLGGIVGVSSLVGGIGIRDTALVWVTERTREIGILKVRGAIRRDTLLRSRLEAGLLALLGGPMGIASGFADGTGIAALISGLPAAQVPLRVVIAAAGFLALAGAVFGTMPASGPGRARSRRCVTTEPDMR